MTHPGLQTLPWWAAIAVAVTTSLVGVLLNAGDKELTNTFAVLYLVGCLGAVLTVERPGVFTAVIQPPLILFVIVPTAYWWFHGVSFSGLKSILINCGYPLIERFPLMLFTSAVVLLIGLLRWYRAMAPQPKRSPARTAAPGRFAALLEDLQARATAILHKTETRREGGRRSPARPPRRARATRSGDAAEIRRRRTEGRRGAPAERGRVPVRDRRVRARSGDAGARRAARYGESARREPVAGAQRRYSSRPTRPRADEAAAPGSIADRRRSRTEPGRTEPGRTESGRTRSPERSAQRNFRPDPRPGTGERIRTSSAAERRRDRPQRVTNSATEGPGATHHPISQVRYRRPDPRH